MKKGLLGFYDYTVVLTYLGMLSALAGIFCALHGLVFAAMYLLLFAGVCDMFDGLVASTKKNRTKTEKRFGIQIDSACDLISFGIMPAMFLYWFMGQTVWAGVFASFFVLCMLIRLCYFNVTEEDRQDETEERRQYYSGLPVTAVALVLPIFCVFHYSGAVPVKIVLPILMTVEAALALIPIRLKKPQRSGKIILTVLGILVAVALAVMKGKGLL